MLLQLKAEKHGVPAEFGEAGGEDYLDQQSFDFYKQDASWAFEEKIKQWDVVLDKMIWSFSQIIDEDWESKYHHGTHETDWVESDTMHKNPISGKMEKTFQMVDRNPDGHWYDSDGHRLHMERIQEGLELFGKYYQNLWD
jgi:hypothetical protein